MSFGRRIGARLLAEGLERRADLATVTALGVDLGQGYLLGRPAVDPAAPRPIAADKRPAATARTARLGDHVQRAAHSATRPAARRPLGGVASD